LVAPKMMTRFWCYHTTSTPWRWGRSYLPKRRKAFTSWRVSLPEEISLIYWVLFVCSFVYSFGCFVCWVAWLITESVDWFLSWLTWYWVALFVGLLRFHSSSVITTCRLANTTHWRIVTLSKRQKLYHLTQCHPRRLDFSASPLWEPQISHCCLVTAGNVLLHTPFLMWSAFVQFGESWLPSKYFSLYLLWRGASRRQKPRRYEVSWNVV